MKIHRFHSSCALLHGAAGAAFLTFSAPGCAALAFACVAAHLVRLVSLRAVRA